MEICLELVALSKSYQTKKVLHELSFKIYKQEILCLLGPNGAAKSTTINLITGSLRPDSGEIYYKGQAINEMNYQYKMKLGVVPQELALYEELTAEQNVRFFASLYGLKKEELAQQVTYALEFVGLDEHHQNKVKTFSSGMKRRLNIACGIAHQPELLIMDEPTVGIDPQSRHHILTAIRQLQQAGTTILYTTHYMEEVEAIASRIIVMDKGELITSGTTEELKQLLDNEQVMIVELAAAIDFDYTTLYQVEGVLKVTTEGNRMEITTVKSVDNLDRIIACLVNLPLKIKGLSVAEDNLETVFLNLTGRRLRD